MRKILLFLIVLITSNFSIAQGDFPIGTIAFVQANADGDDNIAFVNFYDIQVGDVLRFTDNGWLATQAFRNNEGVIEWTADAAISAGSIITIDITNLTANTGTVATVSGSFILSTSGDQVFAFTGDVASPYLVAGIHFDGSTWQSDATSANSSSEPTVFAGTNYAVAIPETDNMAYNGVVTTGTNEEIRDAISNPNNWTTDDTTNQVYSGGNFLLPVELSTFKVRSSNKENHLEWSTASEVNNYMFIIERSANGKDFAEIGTVLGNGTTDREMNYSFVDKLPLVGKNFYRLKQMDFDGKYEHSNIVQAEIRESNTSVYPTVASDFITINVEQESDLQVYNIAGQLVFSKTLFEKTNQVDISELQAGSYFIRINNMVEQFSTQLVKQ